MTLYGFYVYRLILLIKENCNNLEHVVDGHEYYIRGRDKLGMPSHRLPLFCKKNP